MPCTTTSATKTLGLAYLAGSDALASFTHGNGLVTSYQYFPQGPLQQITVGSTPLEDLLYTRDEVYDVDTITETINGTVQSPLYAYGYDGAERLTSASYPAGLGPTDESFGYDDAGNRGDPNNPTAYAYNANNELTKSPASPVLCYDADGNLTTTRSSGDCSTGPVTATYTFDLTNRLSRYQGSGQDVSYLYDPFGRRIRKEVAGGATAWYLWDGDQLLAEYDASGTREVRYAYAGGYAPAQVAYASGGSETIYDVHTDQLDTPRMLTDSSGSAVWRAYYEAFGKAHVSADPDGDPGTPDPGLTFNIRFPGQYEDAESGLHYNRFRYYDPAIGRYISADPMWELAGPNLYLYASLNPTGQIDYYGLWPWGLPGRDRAEKNAPGWVDHYVPDLTDKERDKLINDALDELGWSDLNSGRKLFGDAANNPPDDLSGLSDEQKRFIRDFLRRIEKGNESAVGKCNAALDAKPNAATGQPKGKPSQPDPGPPPGAP